MTTFNDDEMRSMLQNFRPPDAGLPLVPAHGSAFVWREGEPDSAGWWWIKAPNLTARITKVWIGPHGLLHDFKFDWNVTYGRPFQCAGPIPMPNTELCGGSASASASSSVD